MKTNPYDRLLETLPQQSHVEVRQFAIRQQKAMTIIRSALELIGCDDIAQSDAYRDTDVDDLRRDAMQGDDGAAKALLYELAVAATEFALGGDNDDEDTARSNLRHSLEYASELWDLINGEPT